MTNSSSFLPSSVTFHLFIITFLSFALNHHHHNPSSSSSSSLFALANHICPCSSSSSSSSSSSLSDIYLSASTNRLLSVSVFDYAAVDNAYAFRVNTVYRGCPLVYFIATADAAILGKFQKSTQYVIALPRSTSTSTSSSSRISTSRRRRRNRNNDRTVEAIPHLDCCTVRIKFISFYLFIYSFQCNSHNNYP